MNEDRIYCPLAPCLPQYLGPRSFDGAHLSNEQVRESRSFGDFDAYYRHIQNGHFIPKVNAPLPLCLEREEYSIFPANFADETNGAA